MRCHITTATKWPIKMGKVCKGVLRVHAFYAHSALHMILMQMYTECAYHTQIYWKKICDILKIFYIIWCLFYRIMHRKRVRPKLGTCGTCAWVEFPVMKILYSINLELMSSLITAAKLYFKFNQIKNVIFDNVTISEYADNPTCNMVHQDHLMRCHPQVSLGPPLPLYR